MSTYEYQKPKPTQQTQPAAHERPVTGVPSQPTTQAERAVMHPPASMEQDDRHDPDWRYYHACGA